MATPYKTVAFKTLGCKLNYTETSTLSRNFMRYGYSQVSFQDQADVYVINSCSVTDNADKKARKAVRQVLQRSPFRAHRHCVTMYMSEYPPTLS